MRRGDFERVSRVVVVRTLSPLAYMRQIGRACIAGALLFLGCRDAPTTPVSAAAEQLAQSIATAGGRAFIGFKEAGAERGVDADGRVIVAAETQARTRTYLAEQGIVLEHQFVELPAVVATLVATPRLVARLLAHPNIDYIEPVMPGTRW
jgi:hypothetical protein